jgi:hypothetical protein
VPFMVGLIHRTTMIIVQDKKKYVKAFDTLNIKPDYVDEGYWKVLTKYDEDWKNFPEYISLYKMNIKEVTNE